MDDNHLIMRVTILEKRLDDAVTRFDEATARIIQISENLVRLNTIIEDKKNFRDSVIQWLSILAALGIGGYIARFFGL